jgi:hypothetical protein
LSKALNLTQAVKRKAVSAVLQVAFVFMAVTLPANPSVALDLDEMFFPKRLIKVGSHPN